MYLSLPFRPAGVSSRLTRTAGTQLLGIIAHVFLVLSTHYGIGNHLTAVDPTRLATGFLYDWIFNICTIMSSGFGKLAILDILLRIQGKTHKTKRWILCFVGASTMLLNVNQSIIVWFQCKPRAKLWNVLVPGACDAQQVVLSFGVFQGSKSSLFAATSERRWWC